MVTETTVRDVLDKYGRAWTQQDSELILQAFTRDAVYHERVLEEPIHGHKGIREYWQDKVCTDQSDIHFKLLKVYIVQDTAIAEWDADFYSEEKQMRVHMREVAILEFEGERIKHLREYWQSEKY